MCYQYPGCINKITIYIQIVLQSLMQIQKMMLLLMLVMWLRIRIASHRFFYYCTEPIVVSVLYFWQKLDARPESESVCHSLRNKFWSMYIIQSISCSLSDNHIPGLSLSILTTTGLSLTTLKSQVSPVDIGNNGAAADVPAMSVN